MLVEIILAKRASNTSVDTLLADLLLVFVILNACPALETAFFRLLNAFSGFFFSFLRTEFFVLEIAISVIEMRKTLVDFI